MGNGRLGVTSFTKHPSLILFMKPRNVLYLLINEVREYNPPYPQSAFTHNLGTTFYF